MATVLLNSGFCTPPPQNLRGVEVVELHLKAPTRLSSVLIVAMLFLTNWRFDADSNSGNLVT